MTVWVGWCFVCYYSTKINVIPDLIWDLVGLGWGMSEKTYHTYIMASRKNGALYIGVTGDLEGRVWEHKNGVGSRHVRRYNIFSLVYCVEFSSIDEAIDDEKRMKSWRRDWKVELIEKHNPDWLDLAKEF